MTEPSNQGSPKEFELPQFNAEWFMKVSALTDPKPIESLVDLWGHMFAKQAQNWSYFGSVPGFDLKAKLDSLTSLAQHSWKSDHDSDQLHKSILETDDVTLLGIVRCLHLKIHLKEIDETVEKEGKAGVRSGEYVGEGLVEREAGGIHSSSSTFSLQSPSFHHPIALGSSSQVNNPVTSTPIPIQSSSYSTGNDHEKHSSLLETKLIVKTLLSYLEENGDENYSEFINSVMLRLVSTVHPNETERSTNLLHYNSVLEKYIAWQKDLESLKDLSKSAPEYRIRREHLNQLRRAIKAEIEGIWQNNFRRQSPIPVESEARRLLERYKVIFVAFPTYMKFIKRLANEAFWLYKASQLSHDSEWSKCFSKVYLSFIHEKNYDHESRDTKLAAIKETCRRIGILKSAIPPPSIAAPSLFGDQSSSSNFGSLQDPLLQHHTTTSASHLLERTPSPVLLQSVSSSPSSSSNLKIIKPPRLSAPVITFSSWKGGDRDGNPFVVASFSNEIFIEQKAYVLQEYVNIVSKLVDQLTVSTDFMPASEQLIQSVLKDRKTFPYISNVKPWEPYRAKMAYILEKLKNTLKLVDSVRHSAGSTTKPLMGRTLPGPAGYDDSSQLQEDVSVVYHSLLYHCSKAQARSSVQDLYILVNTFGIHLTSIDFRQHSQQNMTALVEYLELNGYSRISKLKSGTEKDKRTILLDLIGSTSLQESIKNSKKKSHSNGDADRRGDSDEDAILKAKEASISSLPRIASHQSLQDIDLSSLNPTNTSAENKDSISSSTNDPQASSKSATGNNSNPTHSAYLHHQSIISSMLSSSFDLYSAEFNPYVLPSMSKVSRDTWESLLVFQDAAKTDKRSVGKFIISMCSNVSDILVILAMMKVVGMLSSRDGIITECPFDVTGLYETVEDLKAAPNIVNELLSIGMIRDYIRRHRNGKLTIMMGYSDSVRDGSSLASDAQIAKTSLVLSSLEDEINRNHPPQELKDEFVENANGSVSISYFASDTTSGYHSHSSSNSSVENRLNIPSNPSIVITRSTSSDSASSVSSNLQSNCHPKIAFVFYRGRGDTIPRGFGGSVTKAVASQIVTTRVEDVTEQNRFLRRYSSVSSTITHLHSLYSAHLGRQMAKVPSETKRWQKYFDFFGRISNAHWIQLVHPPTQQTSKSSSASNSSSSTQPSTNGGEFGDKYFGLLSKYSILPHLPKAHFASRPVARDGVTYNIDSIRAIPFTMFLAQMREFTNAYYGTGTAFEQGSRILQNKNGASTLSLLNWYKKITAKEGWHNVESEVEQDPRVPSLLCLVKQYQSRNNIKTIKEVVSKCQSIEDPFVEKILRLYHPVVPGIEEISSLIIDLNSNGNSDSSSSSNSSDDSSSNVLKVLREMYLNYAPFQFSIQNKETALLIRDSKLVNLYAIDANPEEKMLLKMTHDEAALTEKWILRILDQNQLESKTLTQDFKSPELQILHHIQAKWLAMARAKSGPVPPKLGIYIQMTILAISEALGFAG